MIAEFLGSELGRMEQPASCDLLVVDFEDSPRAPKLTTEGVSASCSRRRSRQLPRPNSMRHSPEEAPATSGCCFLKANRRSCTRSAARPKSGAVRVDRIERHHAVLPKPLAEGAVLRLPVVDVRTMIGAVRATRRARSAGEERWLIPDRACCSARWKPSGKELHRHRRRAWSRRWPNEYGANRGDRRGEGEGVRGGERSQDSDEVHPSTSSAAEVFEDEGPAAAASWRRRPKEDAARARWRSGKRGRRARGDATTRSAPTPASRSRFPAEYSAEAPSSSSSRATPNGLISASS